MPALVLSQAEVRKLLPMDTCIGLMEEALMTLSRGDAVNPLRQGIRLPAKLGILGMMPGYMTQPHALGLKAVAVFPGNHGTEYDSHQGIVLLFDVDNGTPIAILDASEVTAIRTAGATGAATKLLAREDAHDLAILGTGVQAGTHVEAMCAVRDIDRVRVFSRNAERRERFARDAAKRFSVAVSAVDSAQAAVEDADIICTTTSAAEPILHGDWIASGCHINAVGSSIRTTRELDTAAVVRSRLYVDRVESTINEAGDFLFPKQEGAVNDDHIVGEIGAILLGEIEGRKTAEEVTLFKSLGVAVEDLAAAHFVYHEAKREGLGTWVDLGGVTSATA